MLPKSHISAYQEFLTSLELLHKEATVSEPDPTSLFSKSQKLEEFFKQKIMTLKSDDSEQQVTHKLQSINTEIYRELRLLSTSIMFLKSSRNSETSQARLTAIIERLNTLIASCQLIITNN